MKEWKLFSSVEERDEKKRKNRENKTKREKKKNEKKKERKEKAERERERISFLSAFLVCVCKVATRPLRPSFARTRRDAARRFFFLFIY